MVTRIGLRAALLALLGVLFLLLAMRLYFIVPELTIDNVDELTANPSYSRLSRAFGFPLALGLASILASASLAWRTARLSLIKAAHPSAILFEVSLSKKAKKELAHSTPSLASPWSSVLVIRENSISLWSDLPPQPKEFVEAAHVRTFEYAEGHTLGRARDRQIILEWTDVPEWKSNNVNRRLELDLIGGGLLGNSAPAATLTAKAIERAQELLAHRSLGR